MTSNELLRLGFERRLRVVGCDRDENRFIFAARLDLVEASRLHRTLLAEGRWLRMRIVIESDFSSLREPPPSGDGTAPAD